MRTLIIWCEQGEAGYTPSILKASRIMKKLEMKGSIAQFSVAELTGATKQDICVICQDFKGSDYEIDQIKREYNARIWMDILDHQYEYTLGKWRKGGLYWTSEPDGKYIHGYYKPINGTSRYLVDTPF